MDYESEFQEIRAASNQLTLDTRRLSWTLARTVPATIERTVKAWDEQLARTNEAIRVLPITERARIRRDKLKQETDTRQLAARVARHRVEPATVSLARRRENYIARRRDDDTLSFPNALDRFDPVAMIHFASFIEQRRPVVDRMTPAELRHLAQTAFESRDAVGLANFSLVRQRLSRGGISRTADDAPVVKELAEFVEAVTDLRVEPRELLEVVADNIREAQRAVRNCELLQLHPFNAEHDPRAAEAFKAAEAEYAAEAEAAGQ